MTYTDIWNEAYDILEEKGGKAMIAYVYGQRDKGNMSDGDVSILIEDMRDFMVEVVDGRNPHKVPERQWLHEDAMKHDKEWDAGDWTLFCIEMDGKYVACAQRQNQPIMLCAEYKTMRGFDNWRRKYA